MFTLTDGRDYLYQWDINRSVRIADPSVTEVHFCNRTGDCSLVTKVYANPTDSELYADIPNILLQSPFDIRVFAYCDGYTKVEETFKVKARTKPDDYVYTETVILQYSNIVARMDSLEDSLSENLEETVNNYLEEHPVQVDLTGYAKEEYVDTAISNIKFPEPDLTNYATKDYVTNQIDYYTEDFATTGYVEDKIAEIKVPEPDLTGYATERWVSNQGYLKTVPAQYVTEDELSAKGYAKQNELSVYAKKTDIPTVPTKVSQLENDKGYLTEHQSLDGYATTKYVDNAIQEYDKTITEYIDTEIAAIPETDLTGYATEAYVDNVISEIDASEVYYMDLFNATNTKTECSEELSSTADLVVSNIGKAFVYAKLPGYSTYFPVSINYAFNTLSVNRWPELAGVLGENTVEHSGMSVELYKNETTGVWTYRSRSHNHILATKAYVDNAIAGIDIPETDLGNYYTKDETYNKTEVDNAIANVSGGGSSGGGATVLTISGTDITQVSDEDKEALIYLRTYLMENDDVPSDRLHYFRVDTSDNYHFACDITLNKRGTSLVLKSQEGSTEYSYNVSFSSTGELTNIWTSLAGASSGWKWSSDSSLGVSGESHVKIVGYWVNDTDNQVTYDISVGSEWNMFMMESGRKYYVPCYCAAYWESNPEYKNGIWFYNDGSSLTLSCESGTVSDFTPLGYWYWR